MSRPPWNQQPWQQPPNQGHRPPQQPPHYPPAQQHPGQQYPGQQNPGQQYPGQAPAQGQWGSPPPQQPGPAAPPARRRRTGRLVGLAAGALVLLAAGGVGGYLIGHRGDAELDRNAVADGVTSILQKDYGLANVTGMSCPDHMAVTVHATYTCTFTAGSAAATVDIEIENSAGQYVVQGPKS